jgi:hypothetical protein
MNGYQMLILGRETVPSREVRPTYGHSRRSFS